MGSTTAAIGIRQRLARKLLYGIVRERPVAIRDPEQLSPGDPPTPDGRFLVLFDADCGICLYARDLFAALDRKGLLAHDSIGRHANGLLAEVPREELFETWHVARPDGRLEHGGQGLTTVLLNLSATRPLGRLLRAQPTLTGRAYSWFARNRTTISPLLGLDGHPQRGNWS